MIGIYFFRKKQIFVLPLSLRISTLIVESCSSPQYYTHRCLKNYNFVENSSDPEEKESFEKRRVTVPLAVKTRASRLTVGNDCCGENGGAAYCCRCHAAGRVPRLPTTGLPAAASRRPSVVFPNVYLEREPVASRTHIHERTDTGPYSIRLRAGCYCRQCRLLWLSVCVCTCLPAAHAAA